MKDGITVKEVKECKTEAEKKILEILTDLHEDTGCVITDLKFNYEEVSAISGDTTQAFCDLSLSLEF